MEVVTIILAGGAGTRLYPLTMHHAKPAVSFGGKHRLIDIPISNSLHSDFHQIYVLAQHFDLKNYIEKTYSDIQVLTPKEGDRFNGTADAVRKTLPTISKSDASYFLILAGDQLYNINFQKMLRVAKEKDADLTIAAIPVPQKEASRMGLLKIDANAAVVEFVEKPKTDFERFALEDGSYLGSMGIYIFKRDALHRLLSHDLRDDFGYHLITTAVAEKKTFAFVYNGYWEDIGTVESYYKANLAHAKDSFDLPKPHLPEPKIERTRILDSVICEGSLIEGEEISHSVIGLKSHIQQGTIIRDSLLLGCKIGKNCLIEKAILDEDVSLGDNVKLVNKKNWVNYEDGKIFVKDGILIVTAGTNLPDNFEF